VLFHIFHKHAKQTLKIFFSNHLFHIVYFSSRQALSLIFCSPNSERLIRKTKNSLQPAALLLLLLQPLWSKGEAIVLQ
jgi:hypothetical protein